MSITFKGIQPWVRLTYYIRALETDQKLSFLCRALDKNPSLSDHICFNKAILILDYILGLEECGFYWKFELYGPYPSGISDIIADVLLWDYLTPESKRDYPDKYMGPIYNSLNKLNTLIESKNMTDKTLDYWLELLVIIIYLYKSKEIEDLGDLMNLIDNRVSSYYFYMEKFDCKEIHNAWISLRKADIL